MKENTLRIIRIASSFVTGALLIFTSLFTYREHLAEAYELTFLSSFIVGLFFVVNGIFLLLNKHIPQICHLCAAILLLIVFFVCIAFVNQFQMSGGFAFLHIVNPLVVLIYFLLLCNDTKTKVKFVPIVSVIPLLYLVFVLIFGSITGNFIYFFMNYEKVSIWYSVLFILGILAGIFALGFALFFLNRLIQKLIIKKKDN